MAHAATDTVGLIGASCPIMSAAQNSMPIKKKRGPKAGRKAALMTARTASMDQEGPSCDWILGPSAINDPYAFHCDPTSGSNGARWNLPSGRNQKVSLMSSARGMTQSSLIYESARVSLVEVVKSSSFRWHIEEIRANVREYPVMKWRYLVLKSPGGYQVQHGRDKTWEELDTFGSNNQTESSPGASKCL